MERKRFYVTFLPSESGLDRLRLGRGRINSALLSTCTVFRLPLPKFRKSGYICKRNKANRDCISAL